MKQHYEVEVAPGFKVLRFLDMSDKASHSAVSVLTVVLLHLRSQGKLKSETLNPKPSPNPKA